MTLHTIHPELADGFKRCLLLVEVVLLAACGNTPPQPDWLINAYGGLNSYTQAYLLGNSAVADVEFARSKQALSATGKPELMARAELLRCAVRTASLEFDTCPAAQALATDMAAPELAYAAYLTGDTTKLNAAQLAQLPEAHRALAHVSKDAKDEGTRLATLAATPDPLARLVGAGVLMRQNLLPPAGVAVAVDTASAQGWRRPLLAWLGVQLKLAQAGTDTEAAARIQRRIDLTQSWPSPVK